MCHISPNMRNRKILTYKHTRLPRARSIKSIFWQIMLRYSNTDIGPGMCGDNYPFVAELNVREGQRQVTVGPYAAPAWRNR